MTRAERILKDVAGYCKSNVWEFEERLQLALRKMDYLRAPLQCVDVSLYNDIQDAIDDYAGDNELDADCIDVEELIWL
jgi:hypothetical protein